MEMNFKKTVKGMELMAAYVSGLVIAGVTFKIHQYECDVSVILLGGF